MSARRPASGRLAGRLRVALLPAAVSLLLAACGHAPTRPQARDDERAPPIARSQPSASRTAANDPCAPTRVHRDSDYTPGGLYAPGVADGGPSGPIDVSGVQEPVPRREPRARTGNRSPYTVLGKAYRVLDDSRGYHERGVASWYGTKFNGRPTSSGELYDICSFTAAHKTLPLPSYVRVTNLDNGRSLVVRVNDRGPFHEGRVMDLSYAAAVRLGVDRTGTARVDLQAIDPDGPMLPPDTRLASVSRALPSVRALPVQDPDATNPVAPGELYRAAPPPARDVDDEDADAVAETPANAGVPAASAELPRGAPVMVVAGSFADAANARRLADRLSAAGVDGVGLEPVEVQGRGLWRVRIGPVDAADAPALVDRLGAMDVAGARVLRQ